MEDRPVSEEDNCEEEIQFGVVEELPTIGSSNPDYALELEPFPEVRVIRLSSIAEEEARDGDDDIAPITSNPVEAWETIKERLSHERTLTIPTTDSGDLAASPSLQNLTSVFSTKRRSIDSHKRKNEFKMLTSSQLADLFRRLDSDNNGELDLAEFLAMVKKLNLLKYLGLKEDHEAEDYMKRYPFSVFLLLRDI